MHAIRVNQITEASQVSSRTQLVRSDSNLTGFFIGDTMKRIPLVNDKGYALIDNEDYALVSEYNLYLAMRPPNIYITCTKQINCKTKYIYLHRLILKAKKGQEVDHRNGNGLDNRKNNLRFCTRSQNMMNQKRRKGTSEFKGVYWHKRIKKWLAQITVNYKRTHLGYFDSEIKAGKAYDTKAVELFGKFARLNFPKE